MNESPTMRQVLGNFAKKYFDFISTGANVLLLTLAIAMSLYCTSEVMVRMQVQAKIDLMEREALKISTETQTSLVSGVTVRMPLTDRTRASESNTVTNQTIQKEIIARQTEFLLRISLVRIYAAEARGAMDSLILRGGLVVPEAVLATLERALRAIQLRVELNPLLRQFDALTNSVYTTVPAGAPPPGPPGLPEPPEPPEPPSPAQYGSMFSTYGAYSYDPRNARNIRMLLNPATARSDFLLALSMLSCALIGSIVAGLRTGDSKFSPLQVTLGIASGYIIFISIRGGRSVFLMEMAGDTPHMNPYSMSFVGLIVGLFSNKAYYLLSVLVDDLSGRISAAMTSKGISQHEAAVQPGHDRTGSQTTEPSSNAQALVLQQRPVTANASEDRK